MLIGVYRRSSAAIDFLALALQVHLHKRQKLVPIRRDGAMSAVVHYVADSVQDRRSGGRHLVRIQALLAEQAVHRAGRHRGQKLAPRV